MVVAVVVACCGEDGPVVHCVVDETVGTGILSERCMPPGREGTAGGMPLGVVTLIA